MIWEYWQYLTTAVSPAVRKMGYLHEAIAMAARAKRCQQQWGEHYQNCQISIQQAVEQCEEFDSVLIFGAGSLNDVPLELLSKRFKKVLLVDLLFLQAARDKVKPYANIQLIEHDVTESIDAFFSGSSQCSVPQCWLDEPQISLVVSLNLITQLPLLPAKWLMRNFQQSEQTVDLLSKQLIQQHLDYLQQFCGVKCLIADRWDTESDSAGNIVDEFDPWWDIPQPPVVKQWSWELVPLKESNTHLAQKNRVGVSFI